MYSKEMGEQMLAKCALIIMIAHLAKLRHY